MNAYRKIKFHTPGQLAACYLGLVSLALYFVAIIILFV